MLSVDTAVRLPIVFTLEYTINHAIDRLLPHIGDILTLAILFPVILLAFLTLIISKKQIISFYCTVLSLACIIFTYNFSVEYLKLEHAPEVLYRLTAVQLLASVLLAFSYSANPLLHPVIPNHRFQLFTIYLPSIAVSYLYCYQPSFLLFALYSILVVFFPLLPLIWGFYTLYPSLFDNITWFFSWFKILGNGHEDIIFSYLVQEAQNKLPTLLRWHWVLHSTICLLIFLDTVSSFSDLFHILAYSCSFSWVSVVSTSVTVAYLSQFLGVILLYLLDGHQGDEDFPMFSGLFHLIISVQSGITGLPEGQQYHRFLKNVLIMAVGMVHLSHILSVPVVENVCAVQSKNLVVPIIILHNIGAALSEFNTWTFALSVFCVEIIFKVLMLILIYIFFFTWDRIAPRSLENSFDDMLRHIKLFTNIVVFIFGILLFINGLYILIYESGGKVRAIMLSIHAYSNIFVQCKDGWKKFQLRRTASKKLSSLKKVDVESLPVEQRDVCPICFNDITVAVQTPCKHLFHKSCLRKWIYVEDFCPMCKTSFSQTELN